MRFVAVTVTISLLCVIIVNALEFKYHTNKEIEAVLRNFTNTFPRGVFSSLYSIGRTKNGKYEF